MSISSAAIPKYSRILKAVWRARIAEDALARSGTVPRCRRNVAARTTSRVPRSVNGRSWSLLACDGKSAWAWRMASSVFTVLLHFLPQSDGGVKVARAYGEYYFY